MRRFALLLFAGVPTLAAAQGFGVYEQNTCAMGRAGVTAASPCADGSAIFFNPAGLGGFAGTHFAAGVTLIGAQGSFTDDFLAKTTDLDNPVIPVPTGYFTHAVSPKLTIGLGAYAPYGLETRWPTTDFAGRFIGYNTKIRSIYIQPTVAYQLSPRLKMGIGIAYITSRLELHQRSDLSTQAVPASLAALFPGGLPAGTRFSALGIPTGTDFVNAALEATGTGAAMNFGATLKVSDRLTIGGHWLTRKTISYDGTAVFDPVSTGLKLPVAIGPLPAGFPVDNLLIPQFAPDSTLGDGKVTTSITMPPQGSLGLSYKMNDEWTVMADYQLVVWGWFNGVVIDFKNPKTPDLTLTPQSKDTHGFRFGTEYQYSPKVTLRGGFLHHTGASPANFITPLLPEGARNEVTIGAGLTLTPKLRGDLAYQYVRQDDRRGTVNLALGNTGLYKFSAHLVGLGLAYTF